jgi:hypothetical protein
MCQRAQDRRRVQSDRSDIRVPVGASVAAGLVEIT